MPSTYTLNNGIELIGTGEQSGTWGDTTNLNLELLDTALDGQVTVTLSSTGTSGSPNVLPISDGTSSNGRNRMVIFNDGSDIGGTAYVQLTPNDAEKIVYVRNSLSGSRSILLFQGTYNASNDYEIPAGTTAIVFFNGAGTGAVASNVFNNAYFDSLRLGGVSVTAILDEDDMSSDSATALATQQSIKKYVDDKAAAQDTLAEVLANGNTTGGTDILFGDNDKAIFGAGSDLEIYHDGSNSYIDDTGAGELRIRGHDKVKLQKYTGENMFVGIADGSSAIYHDNQQKLATTSTGVDITGQVDVNSAARIDSSGIVKAANGTAAAPTHAFLNDPDNGMYRNTTNTIGFATAGTDALIIDSSQRVLIGGQSDTLTVGGIAALLQVENTSGSAAISIARHTASVNSGYLNFGKSRGADATIVQENDNTGFIQWAGADGTDINSYTAYISSAVDGTPGSNDMPGRLVFWTTADGASSPTERMRISQNGYVGIGTSGDPATNLHVSSLYNTKLRLASTRNSNAWTPGDSIGQIEMYSADGTAPGASVRASIDAVVESAAGNTIDLVFRSGSNTEAMRIDSSQRVLIGHDSSPTDIWGGQENRLQVIGNSWANSGVGIHNYNNGTSSANISFSKSRSGTVGTSGTVVADGDRLGHINYVGDDGTDQGSSAASIAVLVDGTPGSNDMPGRIVFSTTADGASTATERMRINSAGDVKIGTGGTPETKLQVQGGSIENGTILMGANYNGTGMNQNSEKSGALHHPVYVSTTSPKGYRLIGGYADSTRNMVQIGGGTNSAKAATQIVFYTGASATASSNDEAMRIDSSQRVLIGLTSARTEFFDSGVAPILQVQDSGSNAAIAIIRTDTSADGPSLLFGRSHGTGYGIVNNGDRLGRIPFQGADGVDFEQSASIDAYVDGAPGVQDMPGRLVFSTTPDGANAAVERMRITNDGYIRATSKAFVASGGTLTSLYSSGSGAGMYKAGAYSDCGAHIEIGTDANAGWSSMYVNREWESGEDDRVMQIAVNGTVKGSIRASTSGTSYLTSSDLRLKDNIKPIVDATDKLMSMKPVTHTWIADPEAPSIHGFIAQEMQEIVPESVSGEPDGEDMMSMDYGRITPVLVAALQDAHNKITALEKRLTELEIK